MTSPNRIENNPAGRVSRRSFLLGTAAALGAGAVLAQPHALMAETAGSADLHGMAEFVTAKTIDPALAARAGSAIAVNNPDFPAKLAKLQAYIKDNGIADVEALQIDPGFDGDLREAATLLLSALYLGYSGTPKAMSSKDDVQFVTYSEALTYRLTHAYTPIPSYSRWGTGYWADKPPLVG